MMSPVETRLLGLTGSLLLSNVNDWRLKRWWIMAKTSTENRLTKLETTAQQRADLVVCCVQIGDDGPALRADGSICAIDHDRDRVIVIGGACPPGAIL